MMRFPAALFYLLLFLSAGSLAQSPSSRNDETIWKLKRTADFEPIADTSTSAWVSVPWVALQQRKNAGVNYRTKARMLYSNSGIYCQFLCEDEKITSTIKEDFANLFKEDVVEIFFWPDENVPIYLEYELSPRDYELVILVPNLEGEFYGWRPWHYEGKRRTKHKTRILDNQSWIAEVYFPYPLFQPLTKSPPEPGTRWRANLYRIDYDKGPSTWTWQPIEKNFHDFRMYGTLEFE